MQFISELRTLVFVTYPLLIQGFAERARRGEGGLTNVAQRQPVRFVHALWRRWVVSKGEFRRLTQPGHTASTI
jgi:hypothetical protein